MTLEHVDKLFKLIVFLFAISIHESAHAWMANRCGDPTARMLGRISLNPIRHIDPVGTILLPAIAMYYNAPVLGWAKPTPVDPRNFRSPVRDDILTSVVGPISNFLVAFCALVGLVLIKFSFPVGHQLFSDLPRSLMFSETESTIRPLSLLLYEFVQINILLGVFNLIPVPPLDGSHVLRHFLPTGALRVYDTVGMIGLIALVVFGGGLLASLIDPVIGIFNYILQTI